MKKILLTAFLLGNFFLATSQNTCATAVTATAGTTTVGTIDGTLIDGCGNGSASASEWYTYTSTISGIVTITSNLPQNDGITNSDDTYINVYSGSCATLTCVTYNDDVASSNYLSEVSFVVQPGEVFFLEWTDEWNDAGFDFELTETVVNCPTTMAPPFTEDFTNTGVAYVCWQSLDEDGDGFNWGVADYDLDNNGTPDGNPCLRSASYDNSSFSPLTPDNWIISYPIDLSSYASGATIELSWLARGIDENYPDENYSVYVATTNTITDFLASPTTFTEVIGQNGGDGVFVPRTLDISSFYGQTIYVAFRHHDVTDQYELNIDDVAVSGALSSRIFAVNGFSMYPNPAINQLTISSENTQMNSIIVVDVNGRVVKQNLVNATETQINVSDLVAGVYMVTIASPEGTSVQKFVKQ
ncbi:T9SS-dependent choice-of-anchor J family protein [Flavobacterium sp. J27]|uniref:T9SS-dependent choice-of-anchor J family protein n=1 Tax=Flavobacterium sp. J27 TaxID=2060419 RepID=UPI001030CAEE|nr:choice-of-anchor J domain-containing protein [Flavobacterium sp. J27]